MLRLSKPCRAAMRHGHLRCGLIVCALLFAAGAAVLLARYLDCNKDDTTIDRADGVLCVVNRTTIAPETAWPDGRGCVRITASVRGQPAPPRRVQLIYPAEDAPACSLLGPDDRAPSRQQLWAEQAAASYPPHRTFGCVEVDGVLYMDIASDSCGGYSAVLVVLCILATAFAIVGVSPYTSEEASRCIESMTPPPMYRACRDTPPPSPAIYGDSHPISTPPTPSDFPAPSAPPAPLPQSPPPKYNDAEA